MKKKFEPGFVFGKYRIKTAQRKRLRALLKEHHETDYLGNKKDGWENWETPLVKYASPIITNFEDYLLQKAKLNGNSLELLDVGIGGGHQWTKFVKNAPVNFHGTALTKTFDKKLRNCVKLCTAEELHEKFEADSFDVAVSNFGMHDQELIGIENVMHLLKPGGEAFIKMETGLRVFDAPKAYKILDQKLLIENFDGKPFEIGVGLHLQKNSE